MINRHNKNPPGRPTFVPTSEQRKQVEMMTGFGMPQEAIATLITNPSTGKPIEADTLRKHFGDELRRGVAKANSLVGQSLFMQATGGGDWTKAIPTAAIWWSKCRMGWKETIRHQHQFDLSRLSDEELDAFERIAAKASISGRDPGREGETLQ